MAHADYECCAVCDRKVVFAVDAYAKRVICPGCANALGAKGLKITTPEELVEWIRSAPAEELLETLVELGFRRCYYPNEVDDEAIARGIVFDRQTRGIDVPMTLKVMAELGEAKDEDNS